MGSGRLSRLDFFSRQMNSHSSKQPNSDMCFVCGRFGKAQGEIILPDGKIACEAAITLADVPNEILSETNESLLNWRVDH